MTPEQEDLLGLINTLLNQVSEDKVYKHLQVKIGGYKIFMEDTVTTVLLTASAIDRPSGSTSNRLLNPDNTVIDMERTIKGPVFYSWSPKKAAEIEVILRQHYVLDLLSNL